MAQAPQFNPGVYIAQVTVQRLSKPKTKADGSAGNPQFVLSFIPLGRYADDGSGELEQCLNYERSAFRAITDKTVAYLMEDLEYLGIAEQITSFGQLDQDHPQCVSVIGAEIQVVCKHELYQGTMVERWSLNRAGGGLNIEPATRDDVRTLDAMFGSALKAKKPAPASRPAQARPAQAAQQQQQQQAGTDVAAELAQDSSYADKTTEFAFGANAPDAAVDQMPYEDIGPQTATQQAARPAPAATRPAPTSRRAATGTAAARGW